jgi:uncharacterized protein (DUF2141 family)
MVSIALAMTCTVIVLTSCAVKRPLTGGPRDSVAAAVTAFEPASGTTSYAGSTITIRFDDWVKSSVRSSISIQPVARYATSFSGDEVEVEFLEPLLPNTTYSVSLGTDWQDERGNKPARSYGMIFSTGTAIDSGRIDGRVNATSADNAFVFCYPRTMVDTARSLARLAAPYRIPVGSSGEFTVRALPQGDYVVCAVRDLNRDGRIDPSEDMGIASGYVPVGGQATLRLLPPIDRLAPQLISARSTSDRTIVLRCSERIDTSGLAAQAFDVTDSTGRTVPVLATWRAADAADRIVVRTAASMRTASHTVMIKQGALRDSSGNVIDDTARTAAFVASATPDAIVPRIASITPADSAKKIPTGDAVLTLLFSDAMDQSAMPTVTVTIGDTTTRADVIWRDAITLLCTVPDGAPADKQLTWNVRATGMRALSGAVMADTIFKRVLTTANRTDPGVVEGTLTDSLGMGQPLLLRFLIKEVVKATIPVANGATWSIATLPAGQYEMEIVADLNGNGRYDNGEVAPLRFAEPTYRFPTPIAVRSRWTLDGVNLLIPRAADR